MLMRQILEVEIFDLWGDRLHGTFLTFSQERVDIGSSGLCVQVVRGDPH